MATRPSDSFLIRTACVASLAVTLLAAQCSAPPPPEPPQHAWAADMKSTLTIKELMTYVIDPTADLIYDAVVFDSSTQGDSSTAPGSDEDWAKVERGAWELAESANLLMMPRKAEPDGTSGTSVPRTPGTPAPELSGPEIDAKIEADRARWNQFSDAMRAAAVEAIPIIKSRNADAVLDAGSKIDRTCEACHLEYWYPGDKPLVEADAKKKVTFDPPKKDDGGKK